MRIIIQESQFKSLFLENTEDEGFDFKKGFKTAYFNPSSKANADTAIFNKGTNDLKVRKKLLPKSNTMSYNLYKINNMNVNKALKHKMNVKGDNVEYGRRTTSSGYEYDSIEWFLKRSVMYMRYILGNEDVDVITYPQSSSDFNKKVTEMLLSMYPKSEGIKLQPELLVKNVRNITVNVNAARQAGLSDAQISNLQHRLEKWKSDEDIRDVRKKAEEVLHQYLQELIKRQQNGVKGKIPNYIHSLKSQYEDYQNLIGDMRKGMKGKDATLGRNGEIKSWQIKSLEDAERKALQGIFAPNPIYKKIENIVRGKTIVVFDDNISSGATLDDVALELLNLGAKKVIPITIGVIEPTVYRQGERKELPKTS
jgi:hypothetical protein